MDIPLRSLLTENILSSPLSHLYSQCSWLRRDHLRQQKNTDEKVKKLIPSPGGEDLETISATKCLLLTNTEIMYILSCLILKGK